MQLPKIELLKYFDVANNTSLQSLEYIAKFKAML